MKARDIDKLQFDVMQVLRGCKIDDMKVMNVMLSIALSIAHEREPNAPIKLIMDQLSIIKAYQESIKREMDKEA